jgi:hypothetical protein
MGTSTVHRSPLTPHWRVVNNLYRDPRVSRQRLLSEIFKAAADPYVAALGGPEASNGLRILLQAFSKEPRVRSRTDALALSRDLIAQSRDATLAKGWSPFYGDIANRALHATVLSATAESKATRTQGDITRAFLGHLVATCIDHVVSRDLSGHLGEPLISNATAALKLTAELKTAAREVTKSAEVAPALERAAKEPTAWQGAVNAVWKVATAPPRPEPRKKRG